MPPDSLIDNSLGILPGFNPNGKCSKTKVDIDITLDMLAAGLQVLVDSGVLDQGAGRALPTGADEVLVADIYKAMVRARSDDAAVHVTVPGVIEPALSLSSRTRAISPYASLPTRTKG